MKTNVEIVQELLKGANQPHVVDTLVVHETEQAIHVTVLGPSHGSGR